MKATIFQYLNRSALFLLAAFLPLWYACESATQKPLDGKSRQVLDSLTAAGIRQARIEMDSLCIQERNVRLPQLVDSIKQIRLREIEEKMRTVPR